MGNMKQEEKNQKSRELIIESSILEFAAYGMDGASLNRICRENGISKGKMYHHFDSKEELLYACAAHVFTNLCADIASFEVSAEKNLTAIFHDYYEKRIDFWARKPAYYHFLRGAVTRPTYELAQRTQASRAVFIQTMNNKLGEMFDLVGDKQRIAKNKLEQIINFITDYMFRSMLFRVISACERGDMEAYAKYKAECLAYFDELISIMLFGIVPRSGGQDDLETNL